ncbi:polyprenol phosphomannose-dependent alpha 1,6 mannosyltransferase MptB [Nocardia sp. NEAU-351]|uniref:Polyprenol phosphomannose-dependent alpha 1,6 mannosyltransferase MptB n=1 Tax=Nocardia bovistercoris TaxID=2785916 RepID=A0A931I4Q7_9NOCA|nr:polyprenol phosphomannose-dependent alpha 1,6 mannosyltransferase MptB [Nocardia bovistercoris]
MSGEPGGERDDETRPARVDTLIPPRASRSFAAAVTFGRRVVGLDVAPDHTVSDALHANEPEAGGLDAKENAQLRRVRLLGATGSVMMAIGALGLGAQPTLQNPTYGKAIIGLPARVHSSGLAVTMLGTVVVMLAWLLLGRFALGLRSSQGRRLTRSQLDRTLLLWIIPLSVAPPMFSQDVYSYLAQGEIAARGLDPYDVGPVQGLGQDHVLTRSVPNIWQNTPAPYGPLSLWFGKGIAALTGENMLAGVLLHRVLALIGVACVVWALPRLAQRCRVSPVAALWLGAANPLVIFHLVSGVHNEAMMIGLMLVGLELCLAAVSRTGPLRGPTLALFLTGATLLALSAMVKIPSMLALAFVWMALSRRWGGKWRGITASALLLGAVTATVTLAICVGSGLGFGWVGTLGTANAVRSWMSLPTLLGVITGFGGVLLGLGDHTTALLSITRPIAAAAATLLVVRLLIATWSGRLHPVGALGLAFGAVVLLFPVVQPWYLLWGIVPLAAWANRPLFRVPATVASAVVSVLLMPSGSEITPFVLIYAATITILTCLLMILATRKSLPWRLDESGAAAEAAGPFASTKDRPESTGRPDAAAQRPETGSNRSAHLVTDSTATSGFGATEARTTNDLESIEASATTGFGAADPSAASGFRSTDPSATTGFGSPDAGAATALAATESTATDAEPAVPATRSTARGE